MPKTFDTRQAPGNGSRKRAIHVGELVARELFSTEVFPRGEWGFTRAHVRKVTITLPNGTEIDLPVEARVDIEFD